MLRLCLRLGHDLGRTLREIGELDLDELALWIAWYEDHDPEIANDWRAGVIASAVANGPLKGWQRPRDFFPHLARLERRGEEDARAHLLAWTANCGGRVRIAGA